jgi:PTS system mannose-specific IID component
MQNLGFVFAVIPLIKSADMDDIEASRVLNRHLQMFNTHPCLAGAVLGSVVKLEEEIKDGREVEDLKKALMGPYAAMGDAFFWGAWRPFSAIGGVVLMMEGVLWAPLFFLILYNPVPFYVRLKGFIEGIARAGAASILSADSISRVSRARSAGCPSSCSVSWRWRFRETPGMPMRLFPTC